MSASTREATHLIGIVLVSVLIWPNSSWATFMPGRPVTPLGGFFGSSGGGSATDGFHSGTPIGGPVGGGSTIVFPAPNDRRAAFFGLLKLPYIICYYAANGRWPNFPPQLQTAVLDLGRHVFAMDDYGLRNYCSKFFRFTIGHRPCCATSAILPGSGHGGQVGFDEVPGKKPGKRSTKKPTPAPDSEFIPEAEPEGGEDAEAEEPEPEGAEEGEAAEGEDYDAGRLVDGHGGKVQRGSDCKVDNKDCTPKTIPFVPLRNQKDGKQLKKNINETRKPVSGNDGTRTSIPK